MKIVDVRVRKFHFPPAKGDYIMAMSRVENVLRDLVGKIIGQPVYKLLGVFGNSVRVDLAG